MFDNFTVTCYRPKPEPLPKKLYCFTASSKVFNKFKKETKRPAKVIPKLKKLFTTEHLIDRNINEKLNSLLDEIEINTNDFLTRRFLVRQ